MVDGEKDVMSFRLDFDLTMKNNDEELSNVFHLKNSSIGKEGDLDKMTPHHFITSS